MFPLLGWEWAVEERRGGWFQAHRAPAVTKGPGGHCLRLQRASLENGEYREGARSWCSPLGDCGVIQVRRGVGGGGELRGCVLVVGAVQALRCAAARPTPPVLHPTPSQALDLKASHGRREAAMVTADSKLLLTWPPGQVRTCCLQGPCGDAGVVERSRFPISVIYRTLSLRGVRLAEENPSYPG